eukprot:scaffold280_cov391-Pavlova_lutheri.AAC.3
MLSKARVDLLESSIDPTFNPNRLPTDRSTRMKDAADGTTNETRARRGKDNTADGQDVLHRE